MEADPSQPDWIEFLQSFGGEQNLLITTESDRLVDWVGDNPSPFYGRLQSRDEKGLCLLDGLQPCEVPVTSIDHVDPVRFDGDLGCRFDIVYLSIRDGQKCGDITPQIHHAVQFDGSLRFAEFRPRKQGQGQVNDGGIQCIDGVVDIDGQFGIGVFPARTLQHGLGKLLVDSVVTPFVGISKGRFGALLDPDMVKLGGVCIQCTVDVPKAAFLANLGEDHACKLIPAFEMLAAIIAFVFVGNPLEFVAWQELEELGHNERMARHWTCSANWNGV